ncbi:hypothetical protein F4703DRAFT_1743547, partial [Phycomyces blakesleeanus]
FFYENRQGKTYDQSWNSTIDMEEDVNPYHLGTLINIRRYCESQGPKQESLIKELDTRMEDAGKIVGAVKE